MPSKPPKPCAKPGCGRLTTGRFCEAHQGETDRAKDARRGTAAERGYTYRWAKARRTFLKRYPLCAECQRQGRVTPATVVDHIVPHRGDQALFWDRNNWAALCKYHHDRKTAYEVNERKKQT
jgi:5-methylcytosine-specific restriction protein A